MQDKINIANTYLGIDGTDYVKDLELLLVLEAKIRNELSFDEILEFEELLLTRDNELIFNSLVEYIVQYGLI